VFRFAPAHLELELVFSRAPLVFDIEIGLCRDVKPLSRYLDLERLASCQGVRETAKLGHEFGTGVGFLEITSSALWHPGIIPKRSLEPTAGFSVGTWGR
jgi:hypothetical protein